MERNTTFIAYEYKDITVKRDSAELYTDCLASFGWALVEETRHSYQPVTAGIGLGGAYAVPTPPEKMDGLDMVTLKFKRNRRMDNKREIDKLEHECEEALAAINTLEKRTSAYTMGVSLGAGILGACFLSLAVYNFLAANMVLALLFGIVGFAGWAIGFFAHRKVGKKKTAQANPKMQEQFDILYNTCEAAHALLAS